MTKDFRPTFGAIVFGVTAIALYFFAPIFDEGYRWPKYIDIFHTILWNFFYFIPITISTIFSGSVHYYNVIGFSIGILIQSGLMTAASFKVVKWRDVNHKKTTDKDGGGKGNE